MEATPSERHGATRFINGALLVLAATLILGGAAGRARNASTIGGAARQMPTVDRSTIWMDTVQRGEFVQMVRGAGNLVQTEAGEIVARLRIPETQSFDLEVGQTGSIDVGGHGIAVRVVHLDDVISGGTLTVTLEPTEELPSGARPGLSIDGRIRIRTVPDVLFVGKPAYGRSGASMALFKLTEEEGRTVAVQVSVAFGVGSVNQIVVESGLQAGDQVILSDMSRYADYDRVLLR